VSPRRILIVDDEADVARYMAAALEDAGFEPVVAGDADEGLELVRASPPDLVCLDLVMPGRTGLSLYREMCEEPGLRDIPIVVVTGVSPSDATEKLGLGVTLPSPAAYIEKPIEVPRLIEAVRDLVPA
jgi:CheY-like chemotaxis protein